MSRKVNSFNRRRDSASIARSGSSGPGALGGVGGCAGDLGRSRPPSDKAEMMTVTGRFRFYGEITRPGAVATIVTLVGPDIASAVGEGVFSFRGEIGVSYFLSEKTFTISTIPRGCDSKEGNTFGI
ncbi:hypothetical protein J6590_035304 [Homalodisca vitripennis]|nr:hypothetical protein J6590_035304 [Homalodisca vitripennis]